MIAKIFDDRHCVLGEGPLWHPERKQLFWFDIVGKRLLSRTDETQLEWTFDETVSAAGWVDHATLLIASATAFFRFDIASGQRDDLIPLDADNSVTRSNDGRADPHGGFWIGTMGCDFEPNAGAIYRFYRGELRRLYAGITVSNSICFAPSGDLAYWADTMTRQIMSQPLDSHG